jgi:hypothetical protein
LYHFISQIGHIYQKSQEGQGFCANFFIFFVKKYNEQKRRGCPMNKRLVIYFLNAVLFFIFAASRVEGAGIVAGTLQPYLHVEKMGEGAYRFTFTVKNQTERPQKVTFTSGKKYDYILYRNGKKVKQFSEGKVFTQVYQEQVLKQAEELSFTETVTNLEKGHYKIVFWLADRNWPNAKAGAEFAVD